MLLPHYWSLVNEVKVFCFGRWMLFYRQRCSRHPESKLQWAPEAERLNFLYPLQLCSLTSGKSLNCFACPQVVSARCTVCPRRCWSYLVRISKLLWTARCYVLEAIVLVPFPWAQSNLKAKRYWRSFHSLPKEKENLHPSSGPLA